MNKLIILCGSSGTGKTTIQNYLQQKYDISRVLTHTTRPMRTDEQNGVDYYFETPASFKKNHYFETVSYDGKQYGSSREGLDRAWQKHPLVSIVVDTAGAIQYVEKLKSQVIVWHIEVSNPSILEKRLRNRGDDPASIEQRLHSFESQRDLSIPQEIQQQTTSIINDEWEHTQLIIDKLIQQISTANLK